MSTQNEEINRVLENPQNFIISDELEDILFQEFDSNDSTPPKTLTTLTISGKDYVCKIKSVERKRSDYKIKVRVPSLTFENFLEGGVIRLRIHESLYAQRDDQPVVYKDSRILTFTARRIVKDEEV